MNPGCAGCPSHSRSGVTPTAQRRALAAGVHDEMRVAGRGPQDPLVGQPATAAVADVFDDRGQRAAGRPAGGASPGSARRRTRRRSRRASRSTVNPLSTGSNVAARSWLRASASVVAQNSSRSDGTGRSGAYARSSDSGRSYCGTGTLLRIGLQDVHLVGPQAHEVADQPRISPPPGRRSGPVAGDLFALGAG